MKTGRHGKWAASLMTIIVLFATITVSQANGDAEFNINAWFQSKVNAVVSHSKTDLQDRLSLKKEELKRQLLEKIQLEKQRAQADLEQYKQQQLAKYEEELRLLQAGEQDE